MIRLSVIGLGILLLATPAAAQKRLQWDQTAPVGATSFTSAEANAYTYRWYIHGTTTGGTVLPGVSCTTTNAPLTKTCTAPLPPISSGTTINLTASDGTETEHSNPATLSAPTTPTNVRIASLLLRRLVLTPMTVATRVFRLPR